MKDDLHIKNGITIPGHELEITASRSGGPGGQNVNKTSTKVTVRWNVKHTSALSEEQKNRVMQNLVSQLTNEGDLIVYDNESRSQLQNKKMALDHLARKIKTALMIPKKRIKTKIPKSIKEKIYKEKTHRSSVKKMRSKKFQDD